MITDPIADMLTQIRNAYLAKKLDVVIPFSKLKFSISQILTQEGYLESAVKNPDQPTRLCLKLHYDENGSPELTNIKRISKPGRRVYVSWDKLPWVLNNYGVAIISTSHGIMTNREARKKKIGGEIICEVY
ncbi:MAG: 30S ribosomal protein S8 [Patescibacteria group bacterium]|nr:30S ribosomal protein S8 [Patescibacteria group bacterium]